jgi:hypothetical protein
MTADGMVLLACGGYRSGSTLQYNLAGEYTERALLGRRIGFVEPEQATLLPQVWSFVEALGTAVGKTHLAPGVERSDRTWDALLEEDRLCPVYTVRDWRDVAHSWTRKFGQSAEEVFGSRRWALNLASMEGWLARGAHVLRYEDLRADPVGALRTIAGWADLPFDPAAADAAAAAAMGADRPDRDVDHRTLLHHDHVGDPDGGGWTRWSAEDQERLRIAVGPLMERFGYPWQDDTEP